MFFFFCFFFVFFVFWFVFSFCLFGGFKGQVWWPKGPPHLALNPPYLLSFLFFFFCFPLFAFNRKTLVSRLKRHFCVFFCVSLCFSLAFFGPPPIFTFSFFVSLLLFSFFLLFCFSFLYLAFSFHFICFFVSRCSFVFVVLLLVLF